MYSVIEYFAVLPRYSVEALAQPQGAGGSQLQYSMCPLITAHFDGQSQAYRHCCNHWVVCIVLVHRVYGIVLHPCLRQRVTVYGSHVTAA